MTMLPMITYQSRTSARGRSRAASAEFGNHVVAQQGVVQLQGYCSPCVAGIMVCCELDGFQVKCNPRPC